MLTLLLDLGRDALSLICGYMPLKEVVGLRAVAKGWAAAVDENDAIWTDLWQRYVIFQPPPHVMTRLSQLSPRERLLVMWQSEVTVYTPDSLLGRYVPRTLGKGVYEQRHQTDSDTDYGNPYCWTSVDGRMLYTYGAHVAFGRIDQRLGRPVAEITGIRDDYAIDYMRVPSYGVLITKSGKLVISSDALFREPPPLICDLSERFNADELPVRCIGVGGGVNFLAANNMIVSIRLYTNPHTGKVGWRPEHDGRCPWPEMTIKLIQNTSVGLRCVGASGQLYQLTSSWETPGKIAWKAVSTDCNFARVVDFVVYPGEWESGPYNYFAATDDGQLIVPSRCAYREGSYTVCTGPPRQHTAIPFIGAPVVSVTTGNHLLLNDSSVVTYGNASERAKLTIPAQPDTLILYINATVHGLTVVVCSCTSSLLCHATR